MSCLTSTTPKPNAANPAPLAVEPPCSRPSQILIEDLTPQLDCGRYRVKRCPGDKVRVGATIFRDGHDLLQVVVRLCGPGASRWKEVTLSRIDAEEGGDRFSGELTVDAIGRWRWQIVAWTDRVGTWQGELARKLAAGQADVESELSEGVVLLADIGLRARGADREIVSRALELLGDQTAEQPVRREAALSGELLWACRRWSDRAGQARSTVVELDVERERARFGSWYELFPRSWDGLRGVGERVPELAALGFDVLYLTPIHPIGMSRRKGRNDSMQLAPGDPGSPWAIGSPEGGHTAIHPELGTLEDFDRLVAQARAHDIEIAMDFAVQCSADHPWLAEHPEWFRRRPDGTLKYAENPPKRYMDIYNFDFECEQWRSLWEALRDVMLFWVDHGVRVFRVDNPHTKPVAFWEWLIESVRAVAPETIFLSEAFTRVAMMRALAKAGFSQSYTYFTWKNTAWELREYIEDLACAPQREYLRANLFVNTPDILSEHLQQGGPPAFAARLLLAGTLSPSYGIYSGFESFEATPRQEGSEEYLNSEKYEIRSRSLDGPLLDLVGRLNRIRREHPALRRFENISFLPVENDALLAYAKHAVDEILIIVVNLDPHHAQEGIVVVPESLGLAPVFTVDDLLDGERHQWRLGRNYVRLDPVVRVAHLLAVADA